MLVSKRSYSATSGLICICLTAVAGLGFCSSASSTEKKIVAAIDSTMSVSLPQSSLPPVRFFTINRVLAKYDGRADPGQTVHLASRDPNETLTDVSISSVRYPLERGNEPFGLLTFRAPEGLLWAKWRQLEAEIRADEHVISDCRASSDQCSSSAALRFLTLIDKVRGMPTHIAIETINHSINSAVRYVSDQTQHGVPDLWSAPLATFASGQGDCEDYAIAKYVALRQVGVDAENLRLLLVRDRAVGQDHAVLGVRDDGRWFILDNRYSTLAEVAELHQLMPLFAIDQEGVKLFAMPYAAIQPQQVIEMAPAAAAGDYW